MPEGDWLPDFVKWLQANGVTGVDQPKEPQEPVSYESRREVIETFSRRERATCNFVLYERGDHKPGSPADRGVLCQTDGVGPQHPMSVSNWSIDLGDFDSTAWQLTCHK